MKAELKTTARTVTDIDHEATGRSVRAARLKASLSLRSVARKLDVSAAFLSDLERGRRNWTSERFHTVQLILTGKL